MTNPLRLLARGMAAVGALLLVTLVAAPAFAAPSLNVSQLTGLTDGQKVTIASDETLSALKFGVDLFNRGMTDEVFSWDDSGTNRFLLSGRGSWVDNATSAYITAQKEAPDVFKNSAIALNPKGPGPKGTRQ